MLHHLAPLVHKETASCVALEMAASAMPAFLRNTDCEGDVSSDSHADENVRHLQ